MRDRMKNVVGGSSSAFVVGVVLLGALAAQTIRVEAATVKATYLFDGGLVAEETLVPALTAVDPLGLSGFESTAVFGQTRTVYRFQGEPGADRNAGLSLETSGLVLPNDYSVELVFEFTEETGNWRKILDLASRGSDAGLYTSYYGGVLEAYPYEPLGLTEFPTNEFHHVVYTKGADGAVHVYLDGLMEIAVPVTSGDMDIATPAGLLSFFLDDAETGFEEFACGRVALIRVYDGVLLAGEVSALAEQPFPALAATVDADPDTINTRARGNYITVYLEFPEGTSGRGPLDVDVSTVTLQAVSPVTTEAIHVVTGAPTTVGDGNHNGVTDRMVKFDRATVQSWFMEDSPLTFVVKAAFLDGSRFEGQDSSIRVIGMGVVHTNEDNHGSVK